jgi:hypothetical protein
MVSRGTKMKVVYKGIEYTEGDILEYKKYGDIYRGVVCFGVVEDNEYNFEHLEFYVMGKGSYPEAIDVIDSFCGEKC